MNKQFIASSRFLVFGLFLVGLGLPCQVSAQEKPSPNMKYQIGWVAMGNDVTARVNKEAANGWKLKSASMTQCPTRDQAKTYPCVMIVMEKEDK